jgi:peptide/nickel transport system permease protein
MAYVFISFAISMVGAIYQTAALYFIGFAPLAGDNWGIMINLAWTQGAIFFKQSIWYILAPVLAIALFSLGLVLFTRGLEEVFNPRLRGGV